MFGGAHKPTPFMLNVILCVQCLYNGINEFGAGGEWAKHEHGRVLAGANIAPQALPKNT